MSRTPTSEPTAAAACATAASPPRRIVDPGRNCWRCETAGRVAFLIDAAAYFSAFKRAVLNAREQIVIIGWDIDSRLRLERRDPMNGVPDGLRELLSFVADRRPDLRISILLWDYWAYFQKEREWLPTVKLDWRTPANVRVRLDDMVPLGAAHHQKVVVVDDSAAFVGGLDLTEHRWDTPAHAAADAARVTSGGRPYGPYHDVQALVDGPAAAALGDLARQRWAAATGESLPRPGTASDPWPEGLTPDLENAPVAISRTVPARGGRSGIREVEALYLDSIAAARRSIYIETQYLTAERVVAALAARLGEEDGPEIVIVLPKACRGWHDEYTMGLRRGPVLRRLWGADRYGRLRLLTPALGDAADTTVMVHAKIMVVDDRLLRIASSNLNNRSMGFDTECDIAIEFPEGEERRSAVARFRDRLLAEHLDVGVDDVAAAIRRAGSLVGAIDRLRKPGRTLRPLGEDRRHPEGLVALAAVADPDRPGGLHRFLERVSAAPAYPPQASPQQRLRPALLAAFAMSGLLMFWHWAGPAELFDSAWAGPWLEAARESVWAPALVFAIYIVGTLLAVPLTVLVVGTAIAFGPGLDLLYATAGSLVSAVVSFAVGALVGRRLVRRIAGPQALWVGRQLAKEAVIMVVMLRIVPVVPFPVVNLVAGALHMRFGDYTIGTVIGMLPGLVLMTALGNQLELLWLDPQRGNLGALAGLVVLWVLAIGLGRRLLRGGRRWRWGAG